MILNRKQNTLELTIRDKHTVQRSIFEHYAEHEIGRELKDMSDWLDQHLDLLDRVAADINPRLLHSAQQAKVEKGDMLHSIFGILLRSGNLGAG